MSKPFDATTKQLLEADPRGWLALFGVQITAPATVIDSDLSSITTEADKIIRIEEPEAWLTHIEFQTGREHWLDRRIARYNILAEYRHGLPVHSILVLLRPEANSPELTGTLRRWLPSGKCYDEFHYQVVRVWELPANEILAGGLATLPLAPLANVDLEQMPQIVRRMGERIEREAPSDEAKMLWAATYILLGLRFPKEFAVELLRGVHAMKESVTYQAILEEGKAEGFAL